MSEIPEVGDIVEPVPLPPPQGKVVRVWDFNGHFEVEWPSGLKAIVTRPNEVRIAKRARDER